MQYKSILLALIIATAAPSSYGQQKGIHAKAGVTNTKSDSVIVHTGKQGKTGKPVLAANVADKNYSHVPLAGEKAYFGDKNEYVNDFVRKYLELHNKTLGSVQDKSTTPFSVIDDVLEQKNLPKELKYLAVIESALNNNAVSHAGAVGPWQLMASTARMLGLSVNRRSDERTDMYKSTTAATKYLELLYSQLNDWLLVIAAYNSGPVPVQRAIERTGSHNFWDIKQYLPRETQGHVLAFIATASIFENLSKFISLGSVPVDFKFGKEEDIPAALLAAKGVLAPPAAPPATAAIPGKPGTAAPVATTAPAAGMVPVKKTTTFTEDELKNMAIVRITQPVTFDIVMQETGIDKKVLARWNPDFDLYIYNTYPTPFYNLRMPKDKLDVFLQKKESINKKSKAYFAQIK
jgi:membrane-bound lytic murein transglycosylase D